MVERPCPLLQIALDVTSMQEALHLVQMLDAHCDLVEVGTSLIVHEGLQAVRRLRDTLPEATLVADVKVIDGARSIASGAVDAGADIISVVSSAYPSTIATCVDIAHSQGARVVADHYTARLSFSDLEHLTGLGVDYLGLHLPRGRDKLNALEGFRAALASVPAPVVLAGGIDLILLRRMRGASLMAVAVGAAITKSSDPAREACRIRKVLRTWHQEEKALPEES
jgi:3-hexulose-6-phosphate synthase